MSSGASATPRSETAPVFGKEAGPAAFVTTHWSVVLTAGGADTVKAADALARLCSTYWYPLYAYARRRGYAPEDAQDLTQEFFARLLARHWVRRADPQKGRFRTFLLTAMSRFVTDEWKKAHAQKRGGWTCPVSLQLDSAETRYGQEPADRDTPEQCFERRWALTLLEAVLNRLRTEYEQGGKGEFFAGLLPYLVAETGREPYAELALKLNLSEGAVKVAVHRLRKRYRQLLQEEIAQTVATAEEAEEELRHLLAVLKRS